MGLYLRHPVGASEESGHPNPKANRWDSRVPSGSLFRANHRSNSPSEVETMRYRRIRQHLETGA